MSDKFLASDKYKQIKSSGTPDPDQIISFPIPKIDFGPMITSFEAMQRAADQMVRFYLDPAKMEPKTYYKSVFFGGPFHSYVMNRLPDEHRHEIVLAMPDDRGWNYTTLASTNTVDYLTRHRYRRERRFRYDTPYHHRIIEADLYIYEGTTP